MKHSSTDIDSLLSLIKNQEARKKNLEKKQRTGTNYS
jgi:hypothetical protein